MNTRPTILTMLLAFTCLSVAQEAAAQLETRSGHFTTSDGVTLHYLEAGSPVSNICIRTRHRNIIRITRCIDEAHGHGRGWIRDVHYMKAASTRKAEPTIRDTGIRASHRNSICFTRR